MRAGASASKLVPLMQSESSVGIARRASDANLRRSSRSSCTTRQRAEARLVAAMVGSRRSVLVEGLFIGRGALFRHAKCDSQFRGDRDGLSALQRGLVAYS